MARMVDSVCDVVVLSGQSDDVSACLSFLDVVVRYGVVPQASLRPYVLALCRTVNMDPCVMGGGMWAAPMSCTLTCSIAFFSLCRTMRAGTAAGSALQAGK